MENVIVTFTQVHKNSYDVNHKKSKQNKVRAFLRVSKDLFNPQVISHQNQ